MSRFGVVSTGAVFHFGIEIFVFIAYNILNKAADTIADTYPFPA